MCVPLQGHYHQWVCHLESQGGKRAIYYFPVDDRRHGCPINARGPNVSISITLPPLKYARFCPRWTGWCHKVLVNRFINFHVTSGQYWMGQRIRTSMNKINWAKLHFTFSALSLILLFPLNLLSSSFCFFWRQTTIFCCLHNARGKSHKFSLL